MLIFTIMIMFMVMVVNLVMMMTMMVVMVMPPVLNFELPQLIGQDLPSTLPCSNTR